MKLTSSVRPADPSSHPPLRRWLLSAVGAVIVASALCGWRAGQKARVEASGGARATLAKIVHSGGEGETGVIVTLPDGQRPAVAEGALLQSGTRVETDARTRARIDLDDGTTVAVDRATVLVVDHLRPHALHSGAVVVDAARRHEAREPVPADTLVFWTPLGDVRTDDARFSLTALDGHLSVAVARGDVEVHRSRDVTTVHAGEEADVERGSPRIEVTTANDLAQRMSDDSIDASGDVAATGIGELRARKPGSKDEVDGAVRLARHGVTARIVDAMARTEVDETFVNTTDQELEGVWRFPLPADARLERLALEVDGTLVEGEFVDARRASGIWRGVIQHAAPAAPKPVEEVVWVPGPWRDPALLEWQRGGRAELKIFPIPRKGARRVVLAYTQHVPLAGGTRRYVYPLSQGPGRAAIDQAGFDVQVLGAQAGGGVRTRGYDLVARESESGSRLAMNSTQFTPSGDLVVEYAAANRASVASAHAFAQSSGGEDPFVAVTLRPRLPARIADRGRDQAVVVDVGRAMFGERLRLASRLAVAVTAQMDRRDRAIVMACDIECRSLPGGWHVPGAAMAHDVEAFLAGIEADGASDLVGAVRAAGDLPDRDANRDLRIVLLSDGAPSAGYRSAARLAAEIGDALPDSRAEIVAVPIGSDADADTMTEIARAGGGSVVPFAPGRAIDATALEILSATYGAMLRDVTLTLPDGLHDIAPARLAPMRAGGETIVAARMRGDQASGEFVLRGRLGGEPFEARWPIAIQAVSGEENAWVPRTWASMRIADDERNASDASHTEAVALSHRFRVPSRFTSLLVLESEAMFHAFGIARAERTFEWRGESEGRATSVSSVGIDENKDDELSSLAGLAGGGAKAEGAASPKAPRLLAARAVRPSSQPAAARAPMADSAPAATTAAGTSPPFASAVTDPVVPRPRDTPESSLWEPSRQGRWMRRVWFRTAAIASDGRPVIDPRKLESARAALATSPDERQHHAELAKLLIRQGDIEDLGAHAARWASRDPLDVDAIQLRATLRAWRGDRDGALRVVSGVLASPSMTPAAQADVASSLARAEERAGHRARACSLRIAAAEGKPTDGDTVARALACERIEGHVASEARWLDLLKDDAQRARVTEAASRLGLSGRGADPVFGDLVVDASWDAQARADLDVAIIDPTGRRLAWASAAKGVRATDCTSLAHEALGVSTGATGPFLVEVVRADASADSRPVRGTLRITAIGRTQVVPFVLGGPRAQVARVDVRMDSRLEPIAAGGELESLF
jgi:hypothetical protein